MSRTLFALVVAFFGTVSAFAPASAALPASAVARTSSLSMNTKYTVGAQTIGFKKDKKTGSSTSLKGYTVGSRAPAASVKSGTRIDQTAKGRYDTAGGLRGVSKNEQNVATPLVLGLPI